LSGRIRTIKPELLEDERTGNLTPEAFKLFVGAILRADDHGNLRAQPDLLERQVFCFARPSRDIRETLAELSRQSLVGLYEVSGQSYAHVCGWTKHQRVDKPGKPRVPGPSQQDLARFAKARETLANVSRDPPETLAPDLRSPTTTPGPPNKEPEPDACARAHEGAPGGARESGGFEQGSDSFGQGALAAPEPDPSRASLEPTPAFALRLFDHTKTPSPPANDAEVPMPFRDDHTLTLPGLDTQEAPGRSDAPPSRQGGARRASGTRTRGEVRAGRDGARKNDSGELTEERAEDEAPALTQEQQRQKRFVELAEIYSTGIREVTGGQHAVLGREELTMRTITTKHAPGIKEGKLDAWLADKARAYARDRLPHKQFERGFCLDKFLEWLNGGGASAQTPGQPQRVGPGRATQTVDPKTGYIHLRDYRGLPAQGYDPNAPWARAVLNIPSVHDADPPDEGEADETPEAHRAAG
jgi:hypothetical protein